MLIRLGLSHGLARPYRPWSFDRGLVSTALGTKMPGQGCLYLSQKSKFLRMVRFGDTLTVRLEVIDRDEVKKRVTIKTEVFNQRRAGFSWRGCHGSQEELTKLERRRKEW